MVIESALLEEMIAHAREVYDAECCGVVAVEPGPPLRAAAVHRARNIHESPLKFEIDPMELLQVWQQTQTDGRDLGAIYHSHTRSPPFPSQTDINFAANWPGIEWVIIGLGGEQPEVRSYLIEGAGVREVPLEVL